MKKIIFLYLIIMVMVFGSVLFVHAQTSTVPSSTPDLQLPEFTHESSSIASMINKIYIYALSIAGVLAIVMIVYGGISYALDPGNAAKQGEAKEIMQSAIWGIVLLAGAYVILKTINPDLVQLKDLPLDKIQLSTLDLGGVPTDIGYVSQQDPVGTNNLAGGTISSLAKTLLDDCNKGYNGSRAICVLQTNNGSCFPQDKTNPYSIVQQVSNSQFPWVCSARCRGNNPAKDSSGHVLTKKMSDGTEQVVYECTAGGPSGTVTLSQNLLQKLIEAQRLVQQGTLPKFTVTSLTGGSHAPSSNHYLGQSADVTAETGTFTDYKKISDYFNNGRADAYYEFKYYGALSHSLAGCSPSSDSRGPYYNCYTKNEKTAQDYMFTSDSGNQHLHMNF